MMKVKRLKWIAIFIVIFGALILQQEVKASITTYSDESTYLLNVTPYGPFNLPFSGSTSSVSLGGLFTVTPGPDVPAIAVSNIIYNTLPSDLQVHGQSLSNLDFSFVNLQNTFGFTVANATASGYIGASIFEATIFNGTTNVGSTTFNTPSSGEIFFGFESTLSFDFLTLLEIVGDVQNATQYWDLADREFFGNFYVTIPAPSAILLGSIGIGLVTWLRRCRTI